MHSFVQDHALQDSFITFEDEEGVTVVTIGCPAVLERQAAIIRDRLRDLAARNRGRLAVSLKQVRILSSACITELLAVREECRQVGGEMVLFDLSSRLRDLLRSTGLLKRLPLAESRGAAVARFALGRAGRGAGAAGTVGPRQGVLSRWFALRKAA